MGTRRQNDPGAETLSVEDITCLLITITRGGGFRGPQSRLFNTVPELFYYPDDTWSKNSLVVTDRTPAVDTRRWNDPGAETLSVEDITCLLITITITAISSQVSTLRRNDSRLKLPPWRSFFEAIH